MKYILFSSVMSRVGKHAVMRDFHSRWVKLWKEKFPKIECRVLNTMSGSGNELVILSESDSLDELARFKENRLKVAKDVMREDDPSPAEVFVDGSNKTQWFTVE